jgi:hypothetical protein
MPNLHAKIFAIVCRRSIVEIKKQRVIRELAQDHRLPSAIMGPCKPVPSGFMIQIPPDPLVIRDAGALGRP